MRLKTTPQDFRVRELLEWPEVKDGDYVVHSLHKEKLSTAEALSMLATQCKVDRSTIAYAGLKDRQAVTDQFLTIERRAVNLSLPNLKVQPVGTTDRPITSKMSAGNAFTIVVRDLRPTQATQVRRSLPSLVKAGFPNYFDDQRFGCLRHGQGFAMESVLHGDYERALQQLIGEPSPVAITGDVKLKQTIRARWGDWEMLSKVARGPVYEPMFLHLVSRPDDFRGALEFVPLRQRVIQAFAYQSFLWNRAVSQLLHRGIASAQRLRIHTLAGDIMAWKYLAPEREEKLVAMRTPLYGPDGDGGSTPFRRSMERQLERAGLRRDSFLQNEVPGMIWREEQRDVFIKPRDVKDVRIEPDDENPGKVCAHLAFALPRGAYATMLIKRLFAHSWYDKFDERGGGRGPGGPRGGYRDRDDRPRDDRPRDDRRRDDRPRDDFRGDRPRFDRPRDDRPRQDRPRRDRSRDDRPRRDRPRDDRPHRDRHDDATAIDGPPAIFDARAANNPEPPVDGRARGTVGDGPVGDAAPTERDDAPPPARPPRSRQRLDAGFEGLDEFVQRSDESGGTTDDSAPESDES